jgi:hypothetical protein
MTILERAFELAAAGDCRTVSELEKRLKREGYSAVEAHLGGSSIRKQLRGLLAAGRESRAEATPQAAPVPVPVPAA